MTPLPTLLIKDAAELLSCVPDGTDLIGRIKGGSVLISGDKILDVGPLDDLQRRYKLDGIEVVDAAGKIVAPGFIDSHTHVVFGGSRVEEYALKLTGDLDLLRGKGIPTGIRASVGMTRAASEDELYLDAADRLQRMLRHGTTTVESKSGYGLGLEDELKMLRVNARLNQASPAGGLPEVISTFLGAHAFPPDVEPHDYVNVIIEEMLPAVVDLNLARFCDVYIDEGYFNLDQTRRILLAAQELGLLLKVHADQYARLGGAELAIELGAVSVDHLNYTASGTIRRLAETGITGVLMPLIDFAVKHPQPFRAREMLDAGMSVALATDICPGGWTESLQLVMQFACRVYGFSPAEALYAATVGGARALALEDRGVLAPGMLADIQIWDVPVFEDVVYRLGNNAVQSVYRRGELVSERKESTPWL